MLCPLQSSTTTLCPFTVNFLNMWCLLFTVLSATSKLPRVGMGTHMCLHPRAYGMFVRVSARCGGVHVSTCVRFCTCFCSGGCPPSCRPLCLDGPLPCLLSLVSSLPLCFSRVASSALFSVCIPSLGGLSCGLGDRLADVSWRPQPRWPGLPRGSGRPPLQALLDCPSGERPRWSSGPPCPSSPPLPTQQCGQLCVSAVLEGTGTMPGAAVGLPSQVGTELWPEGPFTPSGFLLPPRMEPGSGRLPGLPVPWLQLSPAAPPTHSGWAPFPAVTTPTSPGNRTTPPLAPPARCITVPIHVPQGPG